jgi:predicted chitinase
MKITLADLRQLCPNGKADTLNALVTAFPSVLPEYGITSGLRFCHFIAQAAHETMGFATLQELGGAAYFDRNYGPQTKAGQTLGNTQPGDGARFHGRGIFQLTGRANYLAYGKRLGIDLIANPERASDPLTSLRIACEYWKAHGLNALADADNVLAITRKINGGTNGLSERKAYLAKAKALWSGQLAPASAPGPAPAPKPTVEILPDAPIATGPEPSPLKSPELLSTLGTVGGSGALGFLAFINSPYAFAAFALVIGFAVFIGYRWLKRHDYV